MGAVQKDYWYLLVLIFLPFLKAANQEKKIVTVPLEEGMVLSCLYPWPGNLSSVMWTKVPDQERIAVYNPMHGVALFRHYEDRVEFLKKTPVDGSISLRNVTHQDIGFYQCSIQAFPQGSWTTTIRVEDLDLPPEEGDDSSSSSSSSSNSEQPTTTTTTHAAWADSTLQAAENDNVTIRCKSWRNDTVHAVAVEKMVHGETWSLVGKCKRAELPPPGGEVRGLLCTHDLDVSLQLAGVAQHDGGFYRCTFSTDAGVHSTTVLLTVGPAGGISLSVYMMYIYTGAGVAALILLIIIVILAVRRRRQRRRVEYRVKLHQTQRPHNLYANVSVSPQKRQNKKSPEYVNLRTARSYKSDGKHPR